MPHYIKNLWILPTAAKERRIGFTRLPIPELNQPSPPVPCLSFEQLITAQLEWSCRFLNTLDKSFPTWKSFSY
jgi:hypothetical protein